jgi:hypothetical protein
MTLDVSLASDLITNDQTSLLKPLKPPPKNLRGNVIVGRKNLSDNPRNELLETPFVISEIPEMDIEQTFVSANTPHLAILGILRLNRADTGH